MTTTIAIREQKIYSDDLIIHDNVTWMSQQKWFHFDQKYHTKIRLLLFNPIPIKLILNTLLDLIIHNLIHLISIIHIIL
jgi:hypothetical protein